MGPAIQFLDYVDRYEQGDDHPWGPPTWREHLDAINGLSELMQKSYDDSAPALFEHFKSAFDVAWEFLGQAPTTRGLRLSDAVRSSLAVLGHSANQENKKLAPSGEQIESLRETLEEIRETVNITTGIPDDARQRINQLIDEVFRIVNSSSTPDFARVRSLTDEIVGASIHITLKVEGDERKKFFKNLFKIAGNWFSDATSSSAGNMLSTMAGKMIGTE
ncbi:hypothetical protein [Enteractinococcus helveticum]|uniref:hypothetical protein n=1 Tax=Enteractinococcus helveticum TaxID=1837282 RepID=UPI000A576E18|nr:hypothetical protein [Enteractinococcus helveticum]